MKQNLVDLGFSKEEAQIYLALLKIGQTTAGPIVKKTGLHRQIVYDTLEKLKNKNLVTETIKSNRKNWQAGSPSEILKQIKSKESLARHILPDLLSMQSLSKHQQEVRVFEDVDGFRSVHERNINSQPKNSIVMIMGSSGWQWAGVMEKAKFLKKFEKIRMDKNIGHHLIFFEKERKSTQETIKKYWLKQPKDKRRIYKFLPDQFQSPVGTQVWHNNITLIIYSKPVLIVQIKNDLVVENFKKYFELMWRIAKK